MEKIDIVIEHLQLPVCRYFRKKGGYDNYCRKGIEISDDVFCYVHCYGDLRQCQIDEFEKKEK